MGMGNQDFHRSDLGGNVKSDSFGNCLGGTTGTIFARELEYIPNSVKLGGLIIDNIPILVKSCRIIPGTAPVFRLLVTGHRLLARGKKVRNEKLQVFSMLFCTTPGRRNNLPGGEIRNKFADTL